MKLLKTNINASLLLDKCYFYDVGSNIDRLVARACADTNATKQLALLSRATKECDKFHSYFHFEESFFHFRLGTHAESLKRPDEAIEAYKNAVFLHPLNKAAYGALAKLYESHSLIHEMEILLAEMKERRIVLDPSDKCSRPFSDFENYVAFATNFRLLDKQLLNNKVEANNFWLSFAEFEAQGDIILLKETISRVKSCHVGYHANAALIYYNCALVYEQLGDKPLAKNMMVKSKNLNPDSTHTLDASLT